MELARTFGTPLYVLDEGVVRSRCAEIRNDFTEKWPNTSACYASKAFLTMTMARIVEQEGLGLDVVSGGELFTALKAGFPPARIELHGNAKTEQELRLALNAGVGRIIVDGVMELKVLDNLAAEMKKRPEILIRVSPGVNPHTHAHMITGHTGSKFGLPIEGDILAGAVKFALASKHLALKGFHFHIGSQIFEKEPHVESVKRIVAYVATLKEQFGFETEDLNFGGGFGVSLSPGEPHMPLGFFTDAMMETLTRECAARKLARPSVSIEPGRWIICEAGITLYSVETIKELPGVTYVGVNGGMPDNPRPSLYQAKYRGAIANKSDAPTVGSFTIAGKCCETGDILIESEELPAVERGDILAIFNTGAYNFSMASNYNRLTRPPVVLVCNGNAEIIVARQTFEDLLIGDCVPERLLGR